MAAVHHCYAPEKRMNTAGDENKKRSSRKETVRLLCGSVLAKYNGRQYFADILA